MSSIFSNQWIVIPTRMVLLDLYGTRCLAAGFMLIALSVWFPNVYVSFRHLSNEPILTHFTPKWFLFITCTPLDVLPSISCNEAKVFMVLQTQLEFASLYQEPSTFKFIYIHCPKASFNLSFSNFCQFSLQRFLFRFIALPIYHERHCHFFFDQLDLLVGFVNLFCPAKSGHRSARSNLNL